MEISEHWHRQTGTLSAYELLFLPGNHAGMVLYGEGRWFIAGWDPVYTFTCPPPAITFLRSGVQPPISPDLMGCFSYEFGYTLDPAYPTPPQTHFPPLRLDVYRNIVLVDRTNGFTYTGIRRGEPTGEAHHHDASLFEAEKICDTDSKAQYMEKVAAILSEIAFGNVYQVNLTRQERWAVHGDVRHFALKLYAENPAPFSAFIQNDSGTIVSSSPERFLQLENGQILSSPIKGTAPRGTTEESDRENSRFLLSDTKNRAELAMITDLLRNDLSRICQAGTINVKAFSTLESFTNVHHLVSHITGIPIPGTNLNTILKATFPGGSITGCPKIAAMKQIRHLEGVPRNIYCGSIGWMSSDERLMDFNIAIRTCLIQDGILTFGVGGGVVWDSTPEDEYDETVAKGESIVRCLN